MRAIEVPGADGDSAAFCTRKRCYHPAARQAGRREAGPPGGPRLAQIGFLIHLVHPATGMPHPLSCFVAADDIHDEEQRLVVEQVLGLWLDRVCEE